MCFKLSKKSLTNTDGVDPQLILIFTESIKNSPIDFGIPRDGGVRTAERQNELFGQNVSKCDGYRSKSNHQIPDDEIYGQALDFYAYINGRASWDELHLTMIAGVILSTAKRLKHQGDVDIDITWGGEFGSNNFKGWDKPHMEIKK